MPSYNGGTKEKMQSSFGGRRRGAPNPGIGNLVGSPFAFATVSIAILGWLICLVSAVFCQIRPPLTPSDIFGKFFWWVVVYELLCIGFVSWVIIEDVRNQYAVAAIGYLAIGTALTQLSVNSFISSAQPERIANSVGFIILSIVGFLWIFYFGSAGQTHEYLPPKDARYSTRQSRPMSHNHFDRPKTTASGNNPQGLYTSAQLNGFETSSPVSGYPGGPVGGQDRNPSQTRFQGASIPQTPTTARGPMRDEGMDVDAPAEYPYRAKAIYSYEANPDDANEISFTKHEILEVSDVSGRWWQARKENGEKGIAPSNYLILL